MGKKHSKKKGKTVRYGDKEDVPLTLTEAEKSLVEDMRELQEREITGILKDVWVSMDEAQHQWDSFEWNVRLKLSKLRQMMYQIRSNNDQIDSGKVWRRYDDMHDRKMSVEELDLENDGIWMKIEAEVDSIRKQLINMTKYVDTIRMDKKKIVTEKQQKAYHQWVADQVNQITGEDLLLTHPRRPKCLK